MSGLRHSAQFVNILSDSCEVGRNSMLDHIRGEDKVNKCKIFSLCYVKCVLFRVATRTYIHQRSVVVVAEWTSVEKHLYTDTRDYARIVADEISIIRV